MVTAPDFFWGPESVMMLPYFKVPLDTAQPAAGFFARIVGLMFLTLALGYVKFGVSADAFIKQTLMFHFGALYWIYDGSVNHTDIFVPWVWQLQIVFGLVFGAWGIASLGAAPAVKKE
eukprot:gene8762-24764_t